MTTRGRIMKSTRGKDKPSSHAALSPEKAEKILHDGSVKGHPITKKQRGYFGAVAGKK